MKQHTELEEAINTTSVLLESDLPEEVKESLRSALNQLQIAKEKMPSRFYVVANYTDTLNHEIAVIDADTGLAVECFSKSFNHEAELEFEVWSLVVKAAEAFAEGMNLNYSASVMMA